MSHSAINGQMNLSTSLSDKPLVIEVRDVYKSFKTVKAVNGVSLTITEGQFVLGRPLHRQGVFPPVDILPCLSRLMNNGIGDGKTLGYHREWANQLYAGYAQGQNIKKLMATGDSSIS